MTNLPPVPPAIHAAAEQISAIHSGALSTQDRLAKEAARRAVEQATQQAGQPTTSGR